MLPYYLLLIIPLFVECLNRLMHPCEGCFLCKKKLNFSIIVFFIVWFFILSFRSVSCGIDLANYEYYFSQTQKMSFWDVFKYNDIEQLYYVFSWFVAQISPDFRFFLVVVAFLCTSIIGWFYRRESEIASLTILLFVTNACYGMFYSGMRQSMALLLTVPAYYLTKNKKIIPFILIVLTASYFHTSAIIMFFLYPFFHIPLKSRFFVVVAVAVVCFFFLNTQIFNGILPILGERYVDRYGAVQQTNGYAMWLLFVAILAYSFVALDERKMNPEDLGLRNILFLMTLIQCFAPIHSLAMRMNYYFIMFFPIIFPKLLNRSKDEFNIFSQYLKCFMVIFLTLFFLFGVCNTDRDVLHLYPYAVYWE